ncbi:MAG: hypothetical protein P8I02_03905 [Flavobacteriales bacterium]|nr:hypothetical protein [Flavobacteriales bacterium]
MKKILYIGIILMLASCGADATESATSNQSDVAVEGESTTSTIKIGNIEVMTEDLGEMKWNEAEYDACAKVGDGWRLPTKDELNILYENKDKIGGFTGEVYWSSTEGEFYNYACTQTFTSGYQSSQEMHLHCFVRAVRAF